MAAAVVTTVLCGCDSIGTSGLSAYEIAVKNGFDGTETEWLESLKSTGSVVNQNTYTVDGDSADSEVASNTGLKSAVSVYANFTKTTLVGMGWHYQQQESSYQSAGAGVIFSLEKNGSAFIVTNYHVVYSADSNSDKISSDIDIYLYGSENAESAISATYVGGSMEYDIAVLRIEANDIMAGAVERGTVASVQFADSDEVTAGQSCIAIGNPEANGISVTRGVISVDSEYIQLTGADEKTTIELRVMRTDTGVNSGNSGGGLFDSEGKLIGIVNAKMSTSSVENIAYAIPSNLVGALAENIIDNCYGKSIKSVLAPSLGIEYETSDEYTVLDETTGLLKKQETVSVSSVDSDSALYGKLKVDDVIESISIGDKTVTITREYMAEETLLNAREGNTVVFKVLRDGVEVSVEIEITSSMLASC